MNPLCDKSRAGDSVLTDWEDGLAPQAKRTSGQSQGKAEAVVTQDRQPQKEPLCGVGARAHHLFEAQAAQTPDAIAAICNSQQLTYAQLDAKACALARHLRSLGLTQGRLAGIHLDRSLEMLISVLAVMKAGGAYVPLDPEYPQERLQFMVQDAQLQLILTEPTDSLSFQDPQIRAVHVQRVLAEANHPEFPLPCEGNGQDLAYVIYTSGSTGKPKGVEITHAGLVNFLEAMQREPGCRSADIVLAVTTLSFDIAILELLLPLTVGARVVVASRQAAVDPSALASLITQHSVTLLQATPARWRLLIESGWKGHAGLRALCGGEALSRDLANKLLERCAKVWNLYGPTETTVWACLYPVEPGSGPVPIGRPIDNTSCLVLDAQRQCVPTGTPGELCLGGVQVARGYLGRPELTAERFIHVSTAGEHGRFYRTGDSVRLLPDGNLEFLGRLDNQVKIRGRRIEPGEIEEVLGSHPKVRHCAVTTYEVGPEEKGLAAYVVFHDPDHPEFDEVRQFLRERLPDPMVPTAYVRLSRLPLTPNGKVDRRALPPPTRETMVVSDYIAPTSDLEKRVADIWQWVLHRPRVGVRDNFFELGGYSLLAVHLVAELNRLLNLNLQPMDLLSRPTIEALLLGRQDAGRKPHQPALIPIQTGKSAPAVFFNWHNARWDFLRLGERAERQAPFYITEVPYPTEMLLKATRRQDPVFPTLEELAAPHVALIRSSGSASPCVLAGCSYGTVLSFEVARQLIAQGISVDAVCLFDGNVRPGLKRIQQQIRNKAKRLARSWSGPRLVREPEPDAKPIAPEAPTPSALPDLSPEALDSATWDERWPFINQLWVHIMWHYWPRRLPTRGILFRADDNGAYYSPEEDFDGCLGWSKLFAHGLETVRVPGNHYTIWQEPHLTALRASWVRVLGQIAGPPGA